jgi:hypothetical protein
LGRVAIAGADGKFKDPKPTGKKDSISKPEILTVDGKA